MIISFKDTLTKKDWLHSCLLSSLTIQAISSGQEKQEYEVFLTVNGIQLEPKHLDDLLTNIEKYIDKEARLLYEKKYADKAEEMRIEMNKLDDIISQAKSDIADKFGIEQEED